MKNCRRRIIERKTHLQYRRPRRDKNTRVNPSPRVSVRSACRGERRTIRGRHKHLRYDSFGVDTSPTREKLRHINWYRCKKKHSAYRGEIRTRRPFEWGAREIRARKRPHSMKCQESPWVKFGEVTIGRGGTGVSSRELRYVRSIIRRDTRSPVQLGAFAWARIRKRG